MNGQLQDSPAVVTVPALLSVATVARLLDCSPRTVRRRIAERSLPAVVDHGRVLVRGDELRGYIDRLRRVGGGAAARKRQQTHMTTTSCDRRRISVHRRNGRCQAKWREGAGQKSRTFDRKGDADTFDRELRRRAQLGPALVHELTRATLTLDEFVRTGFRTYAVTLAPATRKQYAWALEHHLIELLDEPLVAIDVPRLAAHQQYLLDNCRSTNTVRQALTRLSGILQIAVEHGHIPGNAARAVRKIRAEPRDEVRPLAPLELEALIAALEGRDRAIAVLAGHLGLRPLEVRMAPWGT